jgi:hypothetical protein
MRLQGQLPQQLVLRHYDEHYDFDDDEHNFHVDEHNLTLSTWQGPDRQRLRNTLHPKYSVWGWLLLHPGRRRKFLLL